MCSAAAVGGRLKSVCVRSGPQWRGDYPGVRPPGSHHRGGAHRSARRSVRGSCWSVCLSFLWLLTSVLLGSTTVILADFNTGRLELAKTMKMSCELVTIDTSKVDLLQEIMRLTDNCGVAR